MYSSELSQAITQSLSRLDETLRAEMPCSAAAVRAWTRQLAPGSNRAKYFEHPLAFPSLLLPWWLDEQLDGKPNLSLQTDLVFSTINGYYYIRLIDNVMDGDATIEPQLLPSLNFFQLHFQQPYHTRFSADHPFWPQFRAFWLAGADAALCETQLTAINERQFWEVSAQKVCAAKIPVAAVAHYRGRPELFESWAAVIDRLGGWHQLLNDLFDWHKDHTAQRITYFLSEAARRKQPDESVTGWVAREGFMWGIDKLQQWMAELKTQAASLNHPPLLDYLHQRESILMEAAAQAKPGLQLIARLVKIEENKG